MMHHRQHSLSAAFRAFVVFAAALPCVLALVSAPAHSDQDTNRLKKQIEILYRDRDAAWTRRDVNAYFSYYDDDYINYKADGSIRFSSKAEYLDRLSPVMASNAHLPVPAESVEDVQRTQDGLIVTLVTKQGSHNRDFLVKRGNRWLIKIHRSL